MNDMLSIDKMFKRDIIMRMVADSVFGWVKDSPVDLEVAFKDGYVTIDEIVNEVKAQLQILFP